MIISFIALIFLYALFGSLAFVYAKRWKTLSWIDAATPFLVVALWMLLTAQGYGHQSLSHVIEVPTVLLATLIFLYIRVFVLDRVTSNHRLNSYAFLGVSLLSVLLIRTFMPYLPE